MLQDSLNKCDHCDTESEQKKNTIYWLASKLYRNAEALKKSEEYVRSFEDRTSK